LRCQKMESGVALLSALDGGKRDERLYALDRLRHLPGGLRTLEPRRLSTAISGCLADESPEVRCRVAALVPDALEFLQQAASATASAAPQEDLLAALQKISQRLAENLGDSREAVRAATRQCLGTHAGTGRNVPAVIKLVVDFGISRQSNWRIRLHNILAIQQFLTSATGTQLTDADIAGLLEALAPCLDDGTELVSHATKQTLAHLETALDYAFLGGVRRAAPAAQRVLEDHGIGQALLADAGASPALPSTRLSTPGPSPEPSGVTRASVRDFHPHQVLQLLESATKWQDRSRVLEDFHQTLLCIPVTESWPHMSEVLLILNRLLTDTNFKITLTTLYIIGDLMDRWSSSMMTVVGAVVPGLIEKLGDNKIVIRQTAMKIFHKIFSAVVRMSSHQYAEKLLHSLTSSLAHRSVHIRLELVGVVIMALLVFEKGSVPYDHEHVVQVMCQALQDPNEKVSTLATEALVVLRSAMGARALDDRMTALLQGNKALKDKVVVRCEDMSMPSVTDEGLVEFPSLTTQIQIQKAASDNLSDRVSPTLRAESPCPSPTRVPNAAMAVGKLGRKMFCLEDSSLMSGSASQSTGPTGSCISSKHSGSVASLSTQAREQQRRPGTTLTSVSSTHSASTIDQGAPSNSTWTKSTSSSSDITDIQHQQNRMPTRGGKNSSSAGSTASSNPERYASNPERYSPAPDAVFEDRQGRPMNALQKVSFSDRSTPEEGQGGNYRSPPASSMRDRRRVPVQPLRVNFKDDMPSELSSISSGSACKVSNHSEWNPRYEESPNYVPNWGGGCNRPITRQARGDKRAQSITGPHTTSLEEFDARTGTQSGKGPHAEQDALFSKSGRSFHAAAADMARPKCAGYLGLMEPDEDSLVSASDVADKLRLLKRPAGGRARSQGSCRTTGSRGSRAQLGDGAENPDAPDLARPSSPLTFGLDEVELAEDLPGYMADDAQQPPSEAGSEGGNSSSFSAPGPRHPRMSAPAVDALVGFPDIQSSSSATDMLASNTRRPRGAKGLSDGAVLYLDCEELPPFDKAPTERWLEDVLRRLNASSDWISQFEGLTDLRRAARYTPQLVTNSGSLRQAVACVSTLVESLRSSVAKGALICFHDLFLAFRKQMDGEIDRAAPLLLMKAVDANGFLSEEAERTLLAMCQSVSEAKCLTTILTLAIANRTKNQQLRAKCAWCLIMLIQRLGARIFRNPDVDRLIQLLSKMLVDASGEVRNLAKLAASALSSVSSTPEEFERLLSRNLVSHEVAKFKLTLEGKSEGRALDLRDSDSPPRLGDESPKRRSSLARASLQPSR